ncbi:MAG: OadG family protein [Faecousia sp.]
MILSNLVLAAAPAEDVLESVGDAGLAAVTGYAVVFLGIILLMFVVIIMGKIMQATQKKAAPAPAAAPAAAPVAADAPTAPGSAGKLKLYDTDPKTAAMLMAIVADKMGKPINELRFISIKEVK